MAVAQIQVRRGTTVEWAAASPVVLASGEPGYDETLKRTKIGDGATEWAALPWIGDSQNVINVMQPPAPLVACVGDGTTDDTAALQAMIAVSDVFLPAPYIFKVTDTIDASKSITSNGATILCHSETPAAIQEIISIAGTTVGLENMTADADAGDRSIYFDTTGVAVGDLLLISDKWPVIAPGTDSDDYVSEIVVVESVEATYVTIQSPIANTYTTATGAYVSMRDYVQGVKLSGFTLTMSDTSDIRFMIYVIAARDVLIENIRTLNHRTTAAKTGIYSAITYNMTIKDCYMENKDTVDGPAIFMSQSTYGTMQNVRALNYSYGLEFIRSNFPSIINCEIKGSKTNGGYRGLKFLGTQNGVAIGNRVSGFGTGFKHEDSGGSIIQGNQFVQCGYYLGSYGFGGINISNQNNAYTPGDINMYNLVMGNNIQDCYGGGIQVAAYSDRTIIANNIIKNVGSYGIYVAASECSILNNDIYDWGTDPEGTTTNFAGIFFLTKQKVMGNKLTNSNATPYSFRASGTFADDDDNVFTGNTALTNPVYSATTFRNIAVCSGNNVNGLGQKIKTGIAAPAAGTYEVGDTVINSAPSAGGTYGWVCVTAGTSGTWKAFGVISA